MRKLLAGGAIATLVLVGCGGGDGEDATPAVTSTPEAAAAQPTTTPEAEESVAWQNFVDFTNAVNNKDYDTARQYVSPGSAAERYVQHQDNVAAAFVAAGQPMDEEVPAVVPDESSGSIEVQYDELSYTWSDLVSDDDGLVVSWTGATGPVDQVLWTESATGTGLGQTVTVASAYRANSGDLWIVVEHQAGEAAAGTATFTGSTIYVGPDNVAREPAGATGPFEIPAGTLGKIVYVFEDAEFGGTLTYEVRDGVETSYENVDITLAIK